MKRKSYWLGIISLLLSANTNAQMDIAEDYASYLKDAGGVELPTEEFGESIDLKSGSVDFNIEFANIPGNNNLKVSAVYGYRSKDNGSLPGYDLEEGTPYLTGVYSRDTGWVVGETNNPSKMRCSHPGLAPMAPEVYNTDGKKGTFFPEEYWKGVRLVLPGGGGGILNSIGSSDTGITKPSAGGPYYWATNTNWFFSCILIAEGSEGFIGLAPNGNKYYFTVPSTKTVPALRKYNYLGETVLQRLEFRFYVSKIEDRFGNWVKYTTNADGARVVESNDGRKLTFTTTDTSSSSRITSVTDGARTWTLENYYDSVNGSSHNVVVTYPDGSKWKIVKTGSISKTPFSGSSCGSYQNQMYSGYLNIEVTLPSGAKALYELQPTQLGFSYVPYGCHTPDTDFAASSSADAPRGAEMVRPMAGGPTMVVDNPNVTSGIGLIKKTVSGPGISTVSYSYDYGPLNNCYANQGAPGQCTSSSPTTRTVTVTESGGDYRKYTFGNKAQENEGLLYAEEVGRTDTGVAQKTVTQWKIFGAIGFPEIWGLNTNYAFLSTSRAQPMVTTITRDGVSFTRTVNSFDGFARPTSVTRSSSLGYSRTETIAYQDNLTKWTIGQVKSITCAAPASCANKVASKTDYDAITALPLKTYSFGALEKTLTYNTDGTLASASDARDGSTLDTTVKYSAWKRGIPQTVTYPATPDQPAAVTKTAVVDNNGWIKSVTDENGAGYTTTYDYDPMGRLKLIDYPNGDSVAWTNTTQSFTPSVVSYYGLPVGAWYQIIETGKRRNVTFYDGLWRPVVEDSYDNTSDAIRAETRSIVVKRYDTKGRIVFLSYPVRSLTSFTDTSLKGTTTSYDALDRPTTVKQDSELGVLTTTTEYLTGFQTRVTNPRGQKTTTRHMAWDQPTTEFPIAVDYPEGAQTTIKRDAFGKTLEVTRSGPDQ